MVTLQAQPVSWNWGAVGLFPTLAGECDAWERLGLGALCSRSVFGACPHSVPGGRWRRGGEAVACASPIVQTSGRLQVRLNTEPGHLRNAESHCTAPVRCPAVRFARETYAMIEPIAPEVAATIGNYVYALRDPRNGAVFYIGKGVGGRVHAHVREALGTGETSKLERIRDIQASGAAVEHFIVRSALASEGEAFTVEQALIDALNLAGAPLTNLVKGHGASRHGLSTVGDMVARYGAQPMPPVEQRMLFVKINRAYSSTDGPHEIYEATRGHWKLSERGRNAVTHAAGVAHGVVRGIYRVQDWFPSEVPGDIERWGFSGEPAPELSHIVGTHVRHLFKTDGQQNPVSYYWQGKEDGAERPW